MEDVAEHGAVPPGDKECGVLGFSNRGDDNWNDGANSVTGAIGVGSTRLWREVEDAAGDRSRVWTG